MKLKISAKEWKTPFLNISDKSGIDDPTLGHLIGNIY